MVSQKIAKLSLFHQIEKKQTILHRIYTFKKLFKQFLKTGSWSIGQAGCYC